MQRSNPWVSTFSITPLTTNENTNLGFAEWISIFYKSVIIRMRNAFCCCETFNIKFIKCLGLFTTVILFFNYELCYGYFLAK